MPAQGAKSTSGSKSKCKPQSTHVYFIRQPEHVPRFLCMISVSSMRLELSFRLQYSDGGTAGRIQGLGVALPAT